MLVKDAVRKLDKGDPKAFDLLVSHLVETDKAIQLSREKGFGITGMGILETVSVLSQEEWGGIWIKK